MKRFLTIEETADLLSVNYHTVYDMLERLGAIDLNQGRKGKRLIRIPLDSVEAYISACSISKPVIPISAPSGSPTRHEIVVLKKDMRSVTPMICSSSLSKEAIRSSA